MNKPEEKKQGESYDEVNDPQDEFIRERVLNREENRRRKESLIKRAAMLVGCALLFGVIVSLVFVVLVPKLQKNLTDETEPETQFVLPTDEAPEETEAETEAESLPQENLRELVESVIAHREWNIADYERFMNTLTDVAVKANKGVVTVSVSTADSDIFDNPVNRTGQSSGVIYSITESDVLIISGVLSEEKASVAVTFCNGSSSPATVKASDHKLGISVISVEKKDINAITQSSIEAIPFGNSLMTPIGSCVVLCGCPRDYVGSVDEGIVSFVKTDVMSEDMAARVFVTNLQASEKSEGCVLDTNGNIIGFILPDKAGSTISAIGISDLKQIIERLSNGKSIAYLGVTGADVTESISKKNEIPMGVYVSEVTMGSPAFEAGLQDGDIISRIDGNEVLSVKNLEAAIMTRNPEEIITVEVYRRDRDEYVEEKFTVILGSR